MGGKGFPDCRQIVLASLRPLHGVVAVFFLCSIVSSAQSLIIPQVADGGGWQTTFVITSTASTAGVASFSFSMDVGGGADQPWNLAVREVSSLQNIPIPAGSTVVLHTSATATITTSGWGTMTASPGIVAYAIFTLRVPARQDQEVTAPASSGATRFLVPFDNTSGFVTSIAFVNLSGASELITAAFRTTGGSVSQAALPSIPVGGHMAFVFPQQFSATGGQSGLAEFYCTTGAFAIIALRTNPTGGFTAVPVYAQTGPPIIVTEGAPIALQGKSFSLTGTLSISGHTVNIYMQGFANSAATHSIEFDDSASSASGLSIRLGMTAPVSVQGNTATFAGSPSTSLYYDVTDPKWIFANINLATITITFTSLTVGAPLTGTVDFTISGLSTPSTSLQGTFTGTLNRMD